MLLTFGEARSNAYNCKIRVPLNEALLQTNSSCKDLDWGEQKRLSQRPVVYKRWLQWSNQVLYRSVRLAVSCKSMLVTTRKEFQQLVLHTSLTSLYPLHTYSVLQGTSQVYNTMSTDWKESQAVGKLPHLPKLRRLQSERYLQLHIPVTLTSLRPLSLISNHPINVGWFEWDLNCTGWSRMLSLHIFEKAKIFKSLQVVLL